MVDLDEALVILQNKARRSIIERLVLEPHYPLQLAKQIGISQQAVMKHLAVLEDIGFVVKMKAASNKGGPPKISIRFSKQFQFESISDQIYSNAHNVSYRPAVR